MRNKSTIFSALIILVCLVVLAFVPSFRPKSSLQLVAIANYGPHSSLDASISGLKQELAKQGFIEHETVEYLQVDVGFDSALIPQMVANIRNKHPKVIVALTSPVAQFVKNAVPDVPMIYSAITDPVAAGLLSDASRPEANISGSSDRQDLRAMLRFAKQLIPHAKRVGLMYSTAEANDLALLKMMQSAVAAENMELLSIPVEQPRDIPMRVQTFKNKVDLIYVGVSGVVQPSLPAIAAAANNMGIPVFNADEPAVEQGLALASYGVDYHAIGANAGTLVAELLNGVAVGTLTPIEPSAKDHHGFINKTRAQALGIKIPDDLVNVTVVE